MNKDNFVENTSEWWEDQQFQQFLHEYVEKDAYKPGQNDKCGVFITYKALYKIYKATLDTDTDVYDVDEELVKLNETADNIEKGLNAFGHFLMDQEKMNSSILFEVRFFLILMLVLMVGAFLLYILL